MWRVVWVCVQCGRVRVGALYNDVSSSRYKVKEAPSAREACDLNYIFSESRIQIAWILHSVVVSEMLVSSEQGS